MSLLFLVWRLDLCLLGRRPGKRKEEGGINTLITLHTRVTHPSSHSPYSLWVQPFLRGKEGYQKLLCLVWITTRNLFQLCQTRQTSIQPHTHEKPACVGFLLIKWDPIRGFFCVLLPFILFPLFFLCNTDKGWETHLNINNPISPFKCLLRF